MNGINPERPYNFLQSFLLPIGIAFVYAVWMNL